MKRVLWRTGALLVIVLFMAAVCVAPDAGAASGQKSKKKTSRAHVISARAALLMDVKSGRKLYSKDVRRKILPASTTKVLTAILVLERLNLDSYVKISPRAARALPSKIYVEAGDKYRVRDLLYAALLKSANDASVALAEAVAGSEEKFVGMMNRRAAQIGARSTLFANAHGLPADDPQYSTAHDMALILREAMKKRVFREMIETKYKKIVSQKGKVTKLYSHNKCLFKGWKQNIYGKTGYTNAARACFMGYFYKGKKAYIVAVFGCSQRWDDIKTIVERFAGVDL